MPLAINFPAWLKPEIIPGLPIRWYGLMYFVAFAIAYLVFRHLVKERKLGWSDDDVQGIFFWGIVGLLVGARLFGTLVYDTSGIYWRQPWLIFWPFRGKTFVGLQGMSFHGGVVGGLLGFLLWCRRHRADARVVGDLFALSIPLGFTFGRIGNFINGELWGRVTTLPFGMIFPHAPKLPLGEPWVREIAQKAGIDTAGLALINLPRHPSQLYEALFEGVILWAILWAFRNRKLFRGFMIGAYLVGYGLFRFVIEYFREPDADLGYRITLVQTDIPPALFSSLFNFTTGQLFCFAMILAGALWWFIAARLPQDSAIGPLLPVASGTSPASGKTGSGSKQEGRRRSGRK